MFIGRNRRYDPEFKREAVNLVVEGGQTIREVERSLGITHGVLKGWIQKYRDHNDAAFKGTVAPESPEAQLRQLQKQNECLRRERDILKKPWPSYQRIRIAIRIHNRAPLQVWSGGDVPRP